MQIIRQIYGATVELKVEGRLDGYWADHLASAIDLEIRQGSHHIQLDLSQVAFLSSAGIGMLVRFYKELRSIQGSFVVSHCSPMAAKVLQLSRLEDVLMAPVAEPLVAESTSGQSSSARLPTRIERSEALYEVYGLAPEAKLECRRLGDAILLEDGGYSKEDCQLMPLSNSSFAIGLGALGEHFEECQGRFGEFIAVGGAVAYMPTDGTNVPDFLLAHGATLPEVQVCYGIECHGRDSQPFSNLIRFETNSGSGPVPIDCLIESCLALVGCEQVGIVIMAESAGLIGAALRRSPAATSFKRAAFEFPHIRDWLSFTVQRDYTKSTVLVAGVAVHGRQDQLAALLRPLTSSSLSRSDLQGHLHAAAFSYRPLQRGQINLQDSVKSLFQRQTLQGVLHLLSDDRSITGSGQSELVRGACWIAPISDVTVQGDRR